MVRFWLQDQTLVYFENTVSLNTFLSDLNCEVLASGSNFNLLGKTLRGSILTDINYEVLASRSNFLANLHNLGIFPGAFCPIIMSKGILFVYRRHGWYVRDIYSIAS